MNRGSRSWAALQVLLLLLAFLHAAHAQCEDNPPTLITVDYMEKVDSEAGAYHNYTNRSMICRWVVTNNDSNSRLSLSHVTISLSSKNSTERACLQVFDLPAGGQSLVGSACAQNTSDLALNSSGRSLEVHFQGPPGSFVYFWVRTISDDLQTDCNRVIDVSDARYSYMETPNFPGAYPRVIRCLWELRASSGFKLQVEYVTFNPDRRSFRSMRCDYLHVYNDGPRTLHYDCGREYFPPTRSPGNVLYLYFRSNFGYGMDGFLVRARAVPEFPGVNNEYFLSDSQPLILDSPDYPNLYPSKYLCWWRVRTREGMTLRAYPVTSVDVPCSDTLSIYDGEDSSVAKRLLNLCGDSEVRSAWSSANVIYIQFDSGDDLVVGTGFQVKVEAVPANQYNCSDYEVVDLGENTEVFVLSPGYPLNFKGSVSCSKAFQTALADHVFRVDAVELAVGQKESSSATGCDTDYASLEIYSGKYHTGFQVGEWCGSDPKASVHTQGPDVYIWLRPGWRTEAGKFKLRVQLVPASSVPTPSYNNGIPVGGILGGFFGALALVFIVVLACCCYRCNKCRAKPRRSQLETHNGVIWTDTSDPMHPFHTEGARYRHPEDERRQGHDLNFPAAVFQMNDMEEQQSYLPPAYPGRSDFPSADMEERHPTASASQAPPVAAESRGENSAENPPEAPPPSYSDVVANIRLYQQSDTYV